VIDQADPRARRKEAKREEILAAAWTLAHRGGLGAISLRDLSSMVGLRQPSLYAYFDSKHALYDAMFEQGNRALLAATADLPVTDDPREAVRDFVRVLLEFSNADLVRYHLLFQRPIPGFAPSEASYKVAIEFYERGRARLAAAGVTDQSDFDLFTALIAGLADQQVANDPGGDRWIRLTDRVLTMFFAYLDSTRKAAR
jgi:AcrR family transcriptional regulator